MRDPGEGVAADGKITTGVDRSLVPERFETALSTAAAAIAEEASDAASVYLYGSVATGRARHAQSDVDLLTVGLAPRQAAGTPARQEDAARGSRAGQHPRRDLDDRSSARRRPLGRDPV